MSATTPTKAVALAAASMTFCYSKLDTVSTNLTFSYRRFALVSRIQTSIYNGPYLINCGYCTSYPGSPNCIFVALHILEHHELDLIKAPIVSHNQIPAYYTLEQRADCVAELKGEKLQQVGWLYENK